MIQYKIGDATKPAPSTKTRVITHVCNDLGKWGSGFVLAVSRAYPKAEAAYRKWFEEDLQDPPVLGDTQMIRVGGNLWIANMIAQHGITTVKGVPPIRYEALEKCLEYVANHTETPDTLEVHMPRIGCGLAGGDWPEVELLVNRTLVDRGVEVFVYDLPGTR